LQFQRVHAADELLVHLLDQGGIPGETAGIQIAHLIDQGLLVEKVQSLVDLALGGSSTCGTSRVLIPANVYQSIGKARKVGFIVNHPPLS